MGSMYIHITAYTSTTISSVARTHHTVDKGNLFFSTLGEKDRAATGSDNSMAQESVVELPELFNFVTVTSSNIS